ncbi:DNA-3-methyladenine glycosylase family protein [Ciceribacter ferrooxidans]|uniref:DNA-3-methyladenine glycosylase II n=1 Tax=Ciceribacter ferrooxidans TaxID=2509717 RepID=A0A4V1RN38_9HYPH|nr:DNA-3-methyladenine glycosylase [Ciceribacter ferrooxidans]RYC04507.1 DNA-3-methyladenine glycosylase 2 family protein [Ciceribacter ferrooxidans]
MRIIRTAEDVEYGVAELCRIDPRLRVLHSAVGRLPLRLMEPGFAGLAQIIVSQMVSRASADAIWGRLVAATGDPTARSYLSLDPGVVDGLGLSRAKAETLRGVAEAITAGELNLASFDGREAEDLVGVLTSYRGIGPWTAEVYLMFCCGHPDVFPAGDVALRTAVGKALGHAERPPPSTVTSIAEAWRPWRSVAARLFWAYYAGDSAPLPGITPSV